MSAAKHMIGKVLDRQIELGLEPAEFFSVVADQRGSVFLDSALSDEQHMGHWSFIAWDPLLIMSSRDRTVCYNIGSRLRWEDNNPWDSIGRTLAQFRSKGEMPAIPFRGGVIGYFGYEMGRHIENVPQNVEDDLDLPESILGFYDTVLAYDHDRQHWHLCLTDFGYRHRPGLDQRIEEVRELAAQAKQHSRVVRPISMLSPLESNFSAEQYHDAVSLSREYIAAGEIYQVNLSQRFHTKIDQDGWSLYSRLRETNTAPFMAFLQYGRFQVASSSPERFIKVVGNKVETRPIKGTRPRGDTPREDAWNKAQLLSSEKDRAELNMIVDLERNDLGKVCTYGTVKVTRHAICESYARVHHLVSTIQGLLHPGKGPVDILKATFPGGSITGAPKIRSMQIIDELEPHARGVYTGAIGYINFDGDLDLNIAIRTMTIKDKRVYFHAGGGIVMDSDPALEYEETLHKAHALIEALGGSIGGF